MTCYLILTILGPDRLGLVSSLAAKVADHQGNWLESRMARLAGQFAGIARIECAEEHVEDLLQALQDPTLNIQVVRENAAETTSLTTVAIDVMGNDHPGIVRALATAIASAGGNVEELTTGLESAPMSGQPMFRAHGVVSISPAGSIADLQNAIEGLGEDLTVDFQA